MRRLETRYFRRAFSLPADRKVRRAVCLFAGDDQCSFCVNGVQVGVSHGHPNLVVADITPHLRPGTNLLAAAATNLSAPTFRNNPGGWIGAVRDRFRRGAAAGHSFGPELEVRQAAGRRLAADRRSTTPTGSPAMELGPLGIAPWGYPWKGPYYSRRSSPAGRPAICAASFRSTPTRSCGGRRPTSADSVFSISTSTAS